MHWCELARAIQRLEHAIEGISRRVLPPMKQFLKTLAQYDAEPRLAFSDGPSKAISVAESRRQPSGWSVSGKNGKSKSEGRSAG